MLNLNQPQQCSVELEDRGEATRKLSPVVETPHFQEKRKNRKPHSGIDKEWILQRCIQHPTTRCWEWQFHKDKWGYGTTNIQQKMVFVHRKVFELWHGPIPNELFVLHECDNPACLNPNHLFLGTNLDNVKDCVKKGRKPSGTKCTSAKLSNEDVLFIRYSGISQTKLGLMFNVSQMTISNVKRGVHYKSNLPAHCWIQTEGK